MKALGLRDVDHLRPGYLRGQSDQFSDGFSANRERETSGSEVSEDDFHKKIREGRGGQEKYERTNGETPRQ